MKRCVIGTALIILFLGFTFSPEKASGQSWRGSGRMMGRSFPFMLERILDLSAEQKAKLEEMREKRFEERWNFQDKMRRMRHELGKLMGDPKADEKKIEDLIDEMAQLRAGYFKGSLRHRKEIKKIFTPEQLEKIDKARKKILEGRAVRFGRFFQQQRSFRQGSFPSQGRFSRSWGRRRGFRGQGFMTPYRWQ